MDNKLHKAIFVLVVGMAAILVIGSILAVKKCTGG
jgi:hypothetical protein